MSLVDVLKTISLVVFIILLVITMVGIINTYNPAIQAENVSFDALKAVYR